MSTNDLPPAQQKAVDTIKGGEIYWKHDNGDVAVRVGNNYYRVNKDGVFTGSSTPKVAPEKPPLRTPKPDAPQWLTPGRRQELIDIFNTFGMPPKCLQGHPMCQEISHYMVEIPHAVWVSESRKVRIIDPSTDLPRLDEGGNPMLMTVWVEKQVPDPRVAVMRLHELKIDERVIAFKQEDHDFWKALKKELHRSGETMGKPRGRWGSISREIRNADRPVYIREAIGISATTFQPVAKVRIMYSNAVVWVELGADIFKDVSKNARRKAIRYGRPLSKEKEEEINSAIRSAVREYFS